MAEEDSKIASLGELTTVDKANDKIPIVDKSDNTDSTDGTTKYVLPKNLPISDATQTALDTKEATISSGTTSQYYRGDKSWQTLDKSAVGLGNVDNTSDANKPISTATQTALDAKEPTISSGTTGQYYRGDKTWQTLNKSSVGLGSVDNTSDADKPVSTAQQTAITDAKKEYFVIACSDETTALTTGTAKATFRIPFAGTLTGVRASVTTAQGSGSILTVDVNKNGTTVLSTKLTIDNSEKTSTTAATAPVISVSSIADDDEFTIDIDQVGSSPTGLKVTLIVART